MKQRSVETASCWKLLKSCFFFFFFRFIVPPKQTAPFETLSLFLLSESLRFNEWILHKDKRQKLILNFVLPVFGDRFAWFSTGHTFEDAIGAPSFHSVIFAPLPPHSLSHTGSVSSHLPESTDNEQDPVPTRQHITLPMFSAEISAQTLIIPQTHRRKDFLIHKTISWTKNKNKNKNIPPFSFCFHVTAAAWSSSVLASNGILCSRDEKIHHVWRRRARVKFQFWASRLCDWVLFTALRPDGVKSVL